MLPLQRHSILLIGLACLTALSTASPTSAADGQWHLRAHAAWVSPELSWQMSPAPGDLVRVDADSAWGLGISGEYRASDLLGVELGILRSSPDVNIQVDDAVLDVTVRASDGLTMTPVSLGLNFHLTPTRRFDLYLGPYLAYVLYGDLEWRVNETIVVGGVPVEFDQSLRMSIANDLAYGAVAGADIPLGPEGWYFSGTLKYLATELDSTDPEGDSETLSLDPFIVAVGFRYSF